MISRFFAAFLLIAALLPAVLPITARAELRVTGRVRTNPTLRYQGIPEQSELSRAVGGFLKACGWFDVVDDGRSDYEIIGSSSGGQCRIELRAGGAALGAWMVPVNVPPRQAAKLVVDTILQKLFNLSGICQTRIAFCADVAKGIKEIYSCDIDGGDLQQVTFFNTLCVEPCFFPDGNSIGYTKYGNSVTDVVQTRFAPKLQSRLLTSFPGLNVGVSVSPDSSRMALILSPDHQVDLYAKPVGDGPLRRLTRDRAVEASPCWSPDGRQICFVSDASGRPQIYAINADGSGRRRLPSVGSEAVTPDWSDDNQIVYATKVGGAYTLAVLDLKTGENLRATNVSGTWESPAWGPDNRQVVCKRSDGPRASLFIVDTWTGKVRQLLATRNALSMPCWSKAKK